MKGELISFKTLDEVELSGFYKQAKRKSKKCVVYIHGLTGDFLDPPLVDEIGESVTRAGFNFLSFNNRGSEIITWFKVKGKLEMIGGARERFEDCIDDIAAAVNYACKRGSSEVVLVGHSTGCQKSVYYQSTTQDVRVKGIILLGPASDTDYEKKRLGKKFMWALAYAKGTLKVGQGDRLFYGTEEFLTFRRFYSLHKPTSLEGTIFNYRTGRMRLLSRINVPVLAAYGSEDHFSVFSPKQELEMIGKNLKDGFKPLIINGAGHSFEGKESNLAGAIARWLRKTL
jgi:pimeloyl-ACP methyl ester carboxylesterase